MSKLAIIIGSTRPERASGRIAEQVSGVATEQGIDHEVVDLKDYDLPFFNEAISPQYNPARQPELAVKAWLEKLAEFDGYIIVTPEYNRSYPAVLKNALDFVDFQLKRKPVGLVAHGSSGGAQAVSHLRGALPGLLAVTVPEATYITNPDNEDHVRAMLGATLESTAWYAEALAAVAAGVN